jgi:IclR family transcriptional regulator, KDG regulon repressor
VTDSIRAVERALDVLLCFSKQTPELSMTQISEEVQMHKSTVHRLLLTLEKKRFVQRDPLTSLYRPGIRLLQLAYLTLEKNDLRQVAAPFMHRLLDQHLETVDLSIFDGVDVVFLDVLESQQRIRLAAATGQRLPAFCTASGKAFLAFMPDDVVKRILEHGMAKYTPFTPTSVKAVLDDLHDTRERGFAISEQEYEDGINAVCAPILDSSGKPIAALAVAGPAYRLTLEHMREIGPSVMATTQEISREIEMSNRPPAHIS